MSDQTINLILTAEGSAHPSGKFFPSVFVGVRPVWEGPPIFDTEGEAVEVAEAKAVLVFRRLFAEPIPFTEATKIDSSFDLETLAALEMTGGVDPKK
jgi:hypothetical protein